MLERPNFYSLSCIIRVLRPVVVYPGLVCYRGWSSGLESVLKVEGCCAVKLKVED